MPDKRIGFFLPPELSRPRQLLWRQVIDVDHSRRERRYQVIAIYSLVWNVFLAGALIWQLVMP